MVGRTDEISLKTARTRAVDLKQKARQGVDPRRPKSTAPSLEIPFERFLEGRGRELSPRTIEFYSETIDGPLSSLNKLPVDKIDRDQVRTLHESSPRSAAPDQPAAPCGHSRP